MARVVNAQSVGIRAPARKLGGRARIHWHALGRGLRSGDVLVHDSAGGPAVNPGRRRYGGCGRRAKLCRCSAAPESVVR